MDIKSKCAAINVLFSCFPEHSTGGATADAAVAVRNFRERFRARKATDGGESHTRKILEIIGD